MMTGKVLRLHALMPVIFHLSDSPNISLEFVVDTGFTDQLTLPIEVVDALKLPLLSRITADLADGSTVEMQMHGATILWNGQKKEVRVLAAGRRPLLGTALLDGFDLFVQFREEGIVSIDAQDELP